MFHHALVCCTQPFHHRLPNVKRRYIMCYVRSRSSVRSRGHLSYWCCSSCVFASYRIDSGQTQKYVVMRGVTNLRAAVHFVSSEPLMLRVKTSCSQIMPAVMSNSAAVSVKTDGKPHHKLVLSDCHLYVNSPPLPEAMVRKKALLGMAKERRENNSTFCTFTTRANQKGCSLAFP